MIDTSTAPPTTAHRLPSIVRTQLALSFLAFILIGAIDAAVGVLLPSMRAYYSINKATVGLLFISSTVGYLISAFGSGLLVERFGLRVFMALGPAVVMLGAITVSFMPPFPALMGGFLLSGFGVGLIDAGLNSYVASLSRNTALLNYLHAFFGVGALLGPALATGVLEFDLPWNSLYYIWVLVALSLLIGFALVFRGQNIISDHSARTAATEAKQGNVLAAVLQLRVVWVASFFLLIYVGAEVSLGSWTFSFLTEERHEATDFSGLAVSGYWLGLTIGRLVLGKVGARLGNRRLIELCLAGVVAGVLLIWLVPISAVTAAGLWLTGFSLGPIFPTVIALMSDLVPARLLPGAIGFLASFGSMGAALLPAAAGALAERFGLWSLMPFVIALTALMLALWVWLASHQHK